MIFGSAKPFLCILSVLQKLTPRNDALQYHGVSKQKRNKMETIAEDGSRICNSSNNAIQNNIASTTYPSRGTNSSRRSILSLLVSQLFCFCRRLAGSTSFRIASPRRRRWNTSLLIVVSYAIGMYLYFSWVVISSSSSSSSSSSPFSSNTRGAEVTQRDTLLNQGGSAHTMTVPYYQPSTTSQKKNDNTGDTLNDFVTVGHHPNSTKESVPNLFQDTLHNSLTKRQIIEHVPHNTTKRTTSKASPQDRSTLHRQPSSYGPLTFFSWILFCLLFRLFSSHFQHRRDGNYFPLRQRFTANFLQYPQQQGLLRQQQQHQQQRHFQSMVTRINQQRQLYGERPLSVDSLRFILLSSPQNDFNGQDYDQLLQLVEENGDVPTFLSDMTGASEAEISRCPSRTLRNSKDISVYKSCSICLEPYQIHDTIRTIPCFHSFHVGCIDPWLRQKATCPICKYSAIG
jgi:hypothetical protein